MLQLSPVWQYDLEYPLKHEGTPPKDMRENLAHKVIYYIIEFAAQIQTVCPRDFDSK